MTKYIVPLTIYLDRIETTVRVTADSPKEAKELAHKAMYDDTDFIECLNEVCASISYVESGEPKAE